MATPKSQKKRTPAKKAGGSKVGLTFPTGRIGSRLRKGRYAPRVSKTSAVYMTAVLSYLVAELLELSSKSMKKGKSRMTPRALTLAVRADDELGCLLKNVTLSKGGVVPKIHDALTKKTGKVSKKTTKKTVKKTKKSKK